ncbi:MAG: hypothetical protein JWO86_3714 [Myxococcaceae bacterium]|nr:hypothetical protein [Myxococcaceae bacterium]
MRFQGGSDPVEHGAHRVDRGCRPGTSLWRIGADRSGRRGTSLTVRSQKPRSNEQRELRAGETRSARSLTSPTKGFRRARGARRRGLGASGTRCGGRRSFARGSRANFRMSRRHGPQRHLVCLRRCPSGARTACGDPVGPWSAARFRRRWRAHELSVWWIRLGVRVERITPGKPRGERSPGASNAEGSDDEARARGPTRATALIRSRSTRAQGPAGSRSARPETAVDDV